MISDPPRIETATGTDWPEVVALLAAAEARARTEGVTTLYLLTLTPAFFDHRGYHPVARDAVPEAVAASAEFERLCPGDAACLTRALDPAVEAT